MSQYVGIFVKESLSFCRNVGEKVKGEHYMNDLHDKEVYLLLIRLKGIYNLQGEEETVKSLREKGYINNEKCYNLTDKGYKAAKGMLESTEKIVLDELRVNEFYVAIKNIEQKTKLSAPLLWGYFLRKLESEGKIENHNYIYRIKE